MIVNVLRLTSHLMLLTLGLDAFRLVLEGFWEAVPPQLYASSEAVAFAEYLEALDLKVPKLDKVLEYERAVLNVLMEQCPRAVAFDFDPLPLLAPGRGSAPGNARAGRGVRDRSHAGRVGRRHRARPAVCPGGLPLTDRPCREGPSRIAGLGPDRPDRPTID